MPGHFSSSSKPDAPAVPPSGSCCPQCTPFKPHQRLEMLTFQRDHCDHCSAVPDPQKKAQFGTQVAMSKDGNVLAVSAPLYDVTANDGALIENNGAVFIYERNPFHGLVKQGTSKWVFRQRLTQPDNLLQDGASAGNPTLFNFGQSIALSQDGFYIVVGAPLQDDAEAKPPVLRAGAVFVFAREPKTCAHWVFVKKLVAERFAFVPLQQNNSKNNCNNDDDNEDGACGCNATNGGTSGSVMLVNDSETDAMFGYDVDISRDGTTIVVGAPFKNGSKSTFSESGAVYIYARDTGVNTGNMKATFNRRCAAGPLFQFRQKLCGPEFPSICAGTMFGFNVATSEFGDLIAVAKPSIDNSMSISCPNSGAVCIFEGNNCRKYEFVQEVTPHVTPSIPNAMFGTGVRVTPDKRYLLVEAPGEDKLVPFKGVSNLQYVGSVYVFERQHVACGSCAQYVQIARLTPDFSNTNIVSVINAEHEITSFDVSDDACVIAIGYETLLDGTSFEGELEGGVVIFRLECGDWQQSEILRPFTEKLLPDPTREKAAFGASVTISGNAELLVVGEGTHLEQPPSQQLETTFAYSFDSNCGFRRPGPAAATPVFTGQGRIYSSGSGAQKTHHRK